MYKKLQMDDSSRSSPAVLPPIGKSPSPSPSYSQNKMSGSRPNSAVRTLSAKRLSTTQDLVQQNGAVVETNFVGMTNPEASAEPVPQPVQAPPVSNNEDKSDESDGEDEALSATDVIKQAIATLKEETIDYRSKDNRKYFNKIFNRNKGADKEKRLENALTVVNECFIEDIFIKFLNIIMFDRYYVDDVELEGKVTVQLNFQKALCVIWNTTDASSEVCQRVLDTGIMKTLLQMLESPVFAPEVLKGNKNKTYVVKGLLGIAHNIVTRLDAREVLRDAGAVDILQIFLRSKFLMVKTKAVMTLSHIITEEENDKINASDQNIKFIVSILENCLMFPSHKSARYGFSAEEILHGLNKIAANDSNKVTIVKVGALPLYVKCLAGLEEEQFYAAQGLWILAFIPEHKPLIRDVPGCIEGLKALLKSETIKITKAAKGALWEIGEKETTQEVTQHHTSGNIKHVMISYQWDCQEATIWLKDKLKEAGYKVWMDVEQMEGSILEAMAEAVENAAVVIVCMSQKYKDSPNCRTEAEYTFRLRKDIVPLMMQKRYSADGWLGAMVGNKLYFNFSDRDRWSSELPNLVKELKTRGQIGADVDVIDSRILTETLSSKPPEAKPSSCESWSPDDVQEWLAKHGLTDLSDKFVEFDGKLLQGLLRMCRTSPDFYYKTLKEDFKLGLVMLLKFTNALERLV